MTHALSRRTFLRQAGWVGAGITIASGLSGCSLIPALPTRGMSTKADAFTWLQLKPDGHFLFYLPRQEMGQGIASTLRLILSEELGVDVKQVDAITPDTSMIAPVKATVGSDTIRNLYEPVTEIAIAMRATLYARAARQLQTEPEYLTFGGRTFATNDGKTISLSDLAANSPVLLDVDEVSRIQEMPRHTKPVRSKGIATNQIEDIVTGAPLYAGDVQLPEMAYGAFVRPLQLGAELSSANFDKVTDDNVITTFFDGEQAGIVATSPAALFNALDKVDTRWELTTPASQTTIDTTFALNEQVRDLEHDVIRSGERPIGPFDVNLSVSVPLAAHAAIEPKAAIARWNKTDSPRLEIWTGTQDAFYVRAHVAKQFGLGEDEVVVHSLRVGGGFGGRALCSVELEAALLAKAANRPVKVHWTRPDEFQEGYHRPPSQHHIQASADKSGVLTDWSHGFKSGHVFFTSAAMPPWLQALTSFASDAGAARGAKLPYYAARTEVAFSDVRIPVKTGPWRGLGAAPNNFAIETAIDQLASKAGIDPLTFRLMNLPSEHKRLSACLTKAAERADWQGSSVSSTSARGIACGIYKEVSYVAIVADIEIDPETGFYQVAKMTCAHDCGHVLNPDQVRAQIEGNIMWGIGMVKSEKLTVERGRLSADYLGEYEIPTMADAPEIIIDLVEPKDAPPVGAGEPAIIAAGAAIANAIAAFTGRPVTELPVTAIKV